MGATRESSCSGGIFDCSCTTGTAVADSLFAAAVVLLAAGGALLAVAGALFAQHVCPGASRVAHMMAAMCLIRLPDLAREIIVFILNPLVIAAGLLFDSTSRVLSGASGATRVVGDGTQAKTRSVCVAARLSSRRPRRSRRRRPKPLLLPPRSKSHLHTRMEDPASPPQGEGNG